MTRWRHIQRETAPHSRLVSLPPVPAKLVAKILKGEYVDMAELLRDNMEAERRRARSDTQNNNSTNRREISDLFSWVQYFGTYAAVVATQSPGKTRQVFWRTRP